MKNGEKLSKDYFDLIRDALKEDQKSESIKGTIAPKRPLKRRKTNLDDKKTQPFNINSEIKNNVKAGIDYKTLIDLTENDVGEFDNKQEKSSWVKPSAKKKSRLKRKSEIITLDSDYSNDEEKNLKNVISSEEKSFDEYSVDVSDFNSGDDDEFDDDDFEDVEIQASSTNDNDNNNDDFTFRLNDTSKSSKSKRALITPELKEERYSYYFFYIIIHLSIVLNKNNWCNNKKLQSNLDPMLPSRIFNSLHPPKDINLPVKSTNKLIHGLKEVIVFWSNYFMIDENVDIGFYMRKWNELKALPYHEVKDFITEEKFVDIILNKKQGSKEISLLGFVALLRSVGLNCRLVYNMQPPDITDIGRLPKRELSRYDYNEIMDCESFKFPIFWCEVWDKYTKKWLTCDPIFFKTVERHVSNAKTVSKLCPRIGKEEQKLITRFVIAFNKSNVARDVTPRYTNKYFSKVYTKRFRNNEKHEQWFSTCLKNLGDKMNSKTNKKDNKLKIDEYEDKYMKEKLSIETFPESMKDFQNHPKFVLQSKIAKTMFYLPPETKSVGFFKNDKVFLRESLRPLKARNKWLQEGRVVKETEKPLLVTKSFNSNTSEKKDKELFIYDQTESYIPHSALPNGKIITNKYGNVEIYHPSMIPINCIMIDHPLMIKAADFLKIEYAKAVVGWDYKKSSGPSNRSRAQKISGKTTSAATARFGGIVCLRDFKDALIAIIKEMELINAEKKALEKEKLAMKEWVNLFKRLKIKERLDGELNESGWLESINSFQENIEGQDNAYEENNNIPSNVSIFSDQTREPINHKERFSAKESSEVEASNKEESSSKESGGFGISDKEDGGFEVSDKEDGGFEVSDKDEVELDGLNKTNGEEDDADMEFEDFMNAMED
ncbi:hypothetical protein QEN19_001769 [Hanseniaspora menglaensis]